MEGVGGGIGKAEAARVRGEAHVDRVQDIPLGLDPQDLQHIPHYLGAAGAVRVHQLQVAEAGSGAMVIDAQGHPWQKVLESLRQHTGGGHIGGDHRILRVYFLGGQALMEPGVPGGDSGVFQHMGGFAQLPQPQAQGGGGAYGIPVRPDVGEDHVIVMGQEVRRCLSPRQLLHGSFPPES